MCITFFHCCMITATNDPEVENFEITGMEEPINDPSQAVTPEQLQEAVTVTEGRGLLQRNADGKLNITTRGRRILTRAGVALAGSGAIILPAAAEGNESVDWSTLGSMIEGAGTLMPSISNLVIAVVPVILLLIVVGFVCGLFDGIISAVRGAMNIFKH